MKMTEKIFINDWLALKPYQKQTVTDGYYLKLCNEVKQAFIDHQTSFIFLMYIEKKDIDFLSCFLCSWFEDLISQTNIYNSFVSAHKQLYKKQLPFYDLDEYYEEEINVQDVCFLIWYFMNTVQTDKFIAPYNDFIVQAGQRVFEVFDNAWDFAPENEYLQAIYAYNENESDFYIARYRIDNLLFKTYLFYPDTYFRLAEQERELIGFYRNDQNLISYLNDNRDAFVHTSHTRLLGWAGKEWAAQIIGKDKSLSSAYLNLSPRIRGVFLYKGQDDHSVFLEYIATGKKFRLTKKSFEHSSDLKEIDTIMNMGIVNWMNEWWFSGVYVQTKFNADLVLDERNSMNSRKATDFLYYQSKETLDTLQSQHEAFLKYNNGLPIAFMDSGKFDSFIDHFIEFYNETLNLSEKETEKVLKRIRKEGYLFSQNDSLKYLSEDHESGLVFFNPLSGIEIVVDANAVFPMESNLYFNEEESEDHILRLFMDESISTELVMYCIDQCKEKLPFFQAGVGAAYLNDIDFLLRFWKKEAYHSKPSVSIIGDKESDW